MKSTPDRFGRNSPDLSGVLHFHPNSMAQNAQNLEPDISELTQEYVVGDGRWFNAAQILAGSNVDPIHVNFGVEAQRRMQRDAEVKSSVEYLVDAVFSDGITPIPSNTDEESPDYDESKKIAEFVGIACSGLKRTLLAILRDMFRNTFYEGIKVGEVVLKVNEDTKLVIDRINPKPHNSTAFVVDKFFNVLGLVGAKNGFIATSALSLNKDEIIPREKFLILNFSMENNDPRGIPEIIAAYEAWCDKRDTRPQYKEWRRTSAIPKKVGITGPGARMIDVTDSKGAKQFNSDGSPKQVSAERALMGALEGFANNSTITAPHGSDIKQLEVNGTGIQFLNSYKYNNSEIRKAILGDSVTTGQDDKGVKAAKEVSMNVVDLRVTSFRIAVADAIERDVYRLLTIVNFGADKVHLTPRCSLGDTERRDWATDMQAATGAGYQVADEHLPELDIQFGLKPRKLIQTVQANPKDNNSQPNANPANSPNQGDSNQ